MLFVTMHPDNWRLEDAKNIAKKILDYGLAHNCLTSQQQDELNTLIKPNLNPQKDHDQIKALWQDLVDTLVITTDKGEKLRFVADEQRRILYFGDEAGIAEAREFWQDDRELKA